MIIKEAVELWEYLGSQLDLTERQKEALRILIDNAVLEKLDEERAIDSVKNMEWDGNPNKLKVNVVRYICQKFGTKKIDVLQIANAIPLNWRKMELAELANAIFKELER